MKKVFLYLYPIKEYSSVFEFPEDFYKEIGRENPFVVLNECIQKRYRENGYEVIISIYPDKEIYKIDTTPEDRIIKTNVTFEEASGYDASGNAKPNEEIKYPSEEDIFNKVGQVDEIVIGGYHFSDCVEKVAEYFYSRGVKTLVDLELTDLFFYYYYKELFNKEYYNPEKFKQILLNAYPDNEKDFVERQFNRMYDNPIYGFVIKPTDRKAEMKKR